jgi:hypothetical protein
MLNSLNLKTTRHLFVGFMTTLLVITNVTSSPLAKPNNWSYKISDNLRFNFQGCSKSNNDLICTANFRSQSGEQKISIGPGWDSNKYVTVTNYNGVVYMADEVKIGSAWVCRAGSTCGNFLTGVGDFTFVEGVNYIATFTFRDISLPAFKIPLFYFSTNGIFSNSAIRIRNLDVADSNSIDMILKPTVNTPAKPSNLSYKLSDTLRFNFTGCSKIVEANNIVCTGIFRSYNGEQKISVGSGSSISITDSKGTTYSADEIRIGDSFSCRSTRCETDLVEGIDYKTSFIFKDVSLESFRISLFYFQSTSEFVGTRFQIKARNIKVTNAR